MNLTYHYTKQRKTFGRQPMFCMDGPQLLDTIPPNNKIQKEYILRNPVNTESQCYSPMSENVVNTTIVTTSNSGINHVEGGWPKDVNFWDDEATSQIRRRVEREHNYIDVVLEKTPELYHYIKQNNAIDIYQSYYEGMSGHQPLERTDVAIKSKLRDPLNRQISSMSWSIEHNELVVSYCNSLSIQSKDSVFIDNTCYVWHIGRNWSPIAKINPPSACCQIVCSPWNGHTFVGGLIDGRVCLFDLRVQPEPILISPANLAHRGPVNCLVYMNTRQKTEIFSGSTDGACKWWDIRNLSEKTDELMCIRTRPGEPKNLSNTEGVTSLHYDKALPTRFLCGTEVGNVVNVNRKGKTHDDIMSKVFDAHIGPVKTVQRSPNISKLMITCGDYSAHVWNEDVSVSPIITGTSCRFPVNDVCWCPNRVSRYMSVSGEGRFCVFDLLRKYHEPIVSMRVIDCPLLKLKAHNEEDIIALADIKGTVHLLSLSDNLAPSEDRDKELMNQLIDRESRREHILESRAKEIKLKLLLQASESLKKEEVVDEENLDLVG